MSVYWTTSHCFGLLFLYFCYRYIYKKKIHRDILMKNCPVYPEFHNQTTRLLLTYPVLIGRRCKLFYYNIISDALFGSAFIMGLLLNVLSHQVKKNIYIYFSLKF
ncbi:hypothetical protein GDO86_007080 [Hymenochirus boettgeri]|uniref:Uncharacterized protein n=1 Tax=Hymenochirus boettgeri TaxID=247094 RepID=A0A8T2IXP0_9PIPI|nr:hypothetical protein GDO86_007080 [Hymenochirus boettgeri]